MKLLYCGSSACELTTFKRLLLVGDEICFTDRPSIKLGENFGTIGHQSPLRSILPEEGSPVKISVFDAPSSPRYALYSPYIEADMLNDAFIKEVYNGLQNETVFASKFIHLQGRYKNKSGKEYTGIEIHKALIHNLKEISSIYSPEIDGALLYQVDSEKGLKETFKLILAEASIHITTAMIMSQQHNAFPVSDDPHFTKLIALRTSHPKYVGGTSSFTPHLGLEFASAVIPEEVLEKIEITDILNYRAKTKDVYEAWAKDMNRIAMQINEIDITQSPDAIKKLIATDLIPKVQEYKNEMESTRDKLFGELIKRVVNWELPTLLIDHCTHLDFNNAMSVFINGLKTAIPILVGAKSVIPPIVDLVKERRDIKRSNSISYLIGLRRKYKK